MSGWLLKRKAESGNTIRLPLSAFGFRSAFHFRLLFSPFNRSHDNSHQLVSFLLERRELRRSDNIGFDEHFKPQKRLVKLLLDDSQFRYEFGIAPRPRCLAKVRGYAGSRTQYL